MSNEEQQMYEVTVAGEYASGSGKGTVRQVDFEEKFTLAEQGGEALSTIQNRLIDARLRKKDPEFKFWRTCALIAQVAVNAKPTTLAAKDIPNMNLEQLADFAIAKKLRTDPHKFGSVLEARKAVQTEIDDAKLAKKVSAEKAAAKAKDKRGNKVQPAKAADDEFEDMD